MKLLRTFPLVAVLALAACSSDDEPSTAVTPAASDVTASEAPEIETTPTAEPSPEPSPDRDGDGHEDALDDYPDDPDRWRDIEVRLECDLDGDFANDETFVLIAADPDFTKVWAAEPGAEACEASRDGSPPTEYEQAALDASNDDDGPSSLVFLYEFCAEVDPDDTYTSGDHSASPGQIAEISGVLALCPDHPHADAYAATAERGRADAELETEGRLFYGGTFLVGDEIQPGTYAIEGEVDGCYWERQDSAGEIIDNNFITSGRRVEVTIRASDYAFTSEGCGQWRPVE